MNIDDKRELIVSVAALQVEPEAEARVDQTRRVRLMLVFLGCVRACFAAIGHF
jgi:hypothetical protein